MPQLRLPDIKFNHLNHDIMPNWCYTQYAVRGDKKQVKRLYNKMKKLQEMETPLVENGFGPSWLGCLVKSLGADPKTVYCRGSWSDLDMVAEDTIRFNTEHAWSRPDEVEDLLCEKFPGLQIFFLEEELGMDIFQTNDIYGEFFTENIIIDEEENGMEYYTMEDALERLSELKGEPVTDWEAAEAFASAINDAQDENDGEGHIWLHKADLV